jgi:hypothetical protein
VAPDLPPGRGRPPRAPLIAALLCSAFALLVVRHARTASATYDEVAHLPAGCSYVRWGDFRLNPEHPPLVKLLAGWLATRLDPWPAAIAGPAPAQPAPAADASLAQIRRAWAAAPGNVEAEWRFGHYFLYGPKPGTLRRLGVSDPLALPTTEALAREDFINDADALLFRGRMAVLALGLLLAALVFLWARDLWGPAGGVLALALFCFDPNFIAHSGLVTTDVGLAAFMFGAVLFLWRTTRRLEARAALPALALFGLAFATKLSAALLAPVFALLAAVRVLSRDPWPIGRGGRALVTTRSKAAAAGALLAAALACAWIAVWGAYGFRYEAAPGAGPLPVEQLVRRAAAIASLPGDRTAPPPEAEIARAAAVARPDLAGRLILLARDRRLLPEACLCGIAYARMAALDRGSFLRGAFTSRGSWSYFPWAFALKTPLPTLAAIAAGLLLALRRREPWAARMAFLVLPVAAYAALSLGSRLNIGHRHLLPVYPFLFVAAGALARPWEALGPRLRAPVAAAALAAVALGGSVVFAPPWNPAVVYPHYLAYFNELAGGPRNGAAHLVDSNLDWGQDLGTLKAWLDERGIREPLYLSYFGQADPRYHGIPHVNLPRFLGGSTMEPTPWEDLEKAGRNREALEAFAAALRPGQLIAVSATNAVGVYRTPLVREVWRRVIAQCDLVDRVGYSIFIYRLRPPAP